MISQLKYRAWYKPLGVMIEPDKLEMINFEVKVLGVYLEMDGRGYHKLRMSDFELMQYTGLKDINGREVYLKDKWTFHELAYTVEWDEEFAMFYLKHPSDKATEDDHMSLGVLSAGKVVGNIYEGEAAKA